MKFFRTCIFTLFCLAVSGSALAGPAPDFLARHIFLGQAYPSGNIYLMPFPQPGESQSEDDYLKSFPWPNNIHYRSLSSNHPYAVKLREGLLSRVIHDVIPKSGPDANVIHSTYIPALELMDDGHLSCDGKPVPPKNSRFQYLGEDFFNQVLDNCNTTEGVPIYKTSETGIYSYAVLAFDKAVELTDIELPSGKKRPMTAREAAEVAKMKKELAKYEKEESECSTNPSYIDDAVILLTAKVKGSELSIRVSTYATPGCEGHMANIYILDILKMNVLVKKFEMTQYVGLI